jgi:tetratricopeptide (TPR) repeat protein
VESDARVLRERIGEAALELLEAFLRGGPSVLRCEDAQWFDEETRDLVARLVRAGGPSRLVLVTTRDRAAAPRGEAAVTISLAPLDPDATAELVGELGGDALRPEDVREVVARSDGVPLYLEELVRARFERPTGPDLPDPEGFAIPDLPAVPEVLYEPLVARLHQTADGALLVAVAATIGREVDRSVLARVSELTPQALDDALADLLELAIVERTAEQDRYRFRHELLRAVAYDLQTPSRRRQLHGRVADALVGEAADDGAVDWGVVGTHLAAATRPGEAAGAFERAAAAARRRGALAEARSLLGQAIEIAAEAPSSALDELEVSLRLQRGFIAVSMEGNSSAEAAIDYERCLELSFDLESSERFHSTLYALWSYYCAKAEFDRAEELLDALDRSPRTADPAVQFLSITGRGMIDCYRGKIIDGVARTEAAIALAAAVEEVEGYRDWWFVPLDPKVSGHTLLSTCRTLAGDVTGGMPQMEAARIVASALPFPQGPFSLAGHLSFEVWLYGELGFLDVAQERLTEIEEVATRHGFDQWSIVATTAREVMGGLRILEEHSELAELPPEATAALSRHAAALGGHLAMWKMVEQWVFVTYYATIQGMMHAAAGEQAQAIAVLEDALELADRTGMRFYDVETRRHLAALAPSPAARADGLRAALALAREQGTLIYELRAASDLHRATGDEAPLRSVVGRFSPSVTFPALEAARSLVAGW